MTKGKATVAKPRIAWGRYLLLFFVAAWMFILGVLVGRGTAPVHFDTQALQKELADLRDAMMQKERESVEKAIRGETEKAPLEFYEALKTDEPDTAVQIPVPQEPKGETTAPATAAVKPASAPRPVPQQPAPPTGMLTIQVASMKDGAAADRIVANLKKEGYPAYLSRIVIPDKGLWFRVRVGRYQNREQAAADMGRLTRNKKNPILVKN